MRRIGDSSMAKQYKKLRQKIHPQKKPSSQEKPVGKDYFLIGITLFTAVVLALGWQHFDSMNRAMYVLLIISLGLTYVRRHFELTETQQVLADRAGFISIGFAVALFIVICYYQFVG